MDLTGENTIVAVRRPYNSPVEAGLRAVVLLGSLRPRLVDIQKLIYLDYLLVHSADVPGGPPSLHPPIPHRSGEWIVKRKALMAGLDYMYSKELITKVISPEGILYQGNDLSELLVQRLGTPYAQRLKSVAEWVSSTFAELDNLSLASFMYTNADKSGAEFGFESVLRGIPE